ncbi:MAG TPA: DUF4259 domain-containing protein [Polyangiaceae bacterium]|nr:DUF4259 domain-containing protein [Polyangiaceae bacterium]
MGAWGEGSLQNDAALDWVMELKAEGVAAVREALSTVASYSLDDYLDVDDGNRAIAAAEVVAAAFGPHDRVKLPFAAWLKAHGKALTEDDKQLACKAVQRVLAKNSELRGLWDDYGDDSPWHQGVDDLLSRLADR